MYKDNWKGWDDFLGVMRSFEDSRDRSRTLGLKSSEEWAKLVEKVTTRPYESIHQ